MNWIFLGLKPYRDVLDLQHRVREAVRQHVLDDTLILVEHSPVITLGRSANQRNVVASAELLAARGIDVVPIERGGDVTYHGPGQLVGYPIRHIGRNIRKHVDAMISTLKDVLYAHNIESSWRDDTPGLWTQRGKIAAIGVDARRGVTMHGFSLNVTTRLEDYALIVPCGLQAPVTSMAEHHVHTTVADIAHKFLTYWCSRFEGQQREFSLDTLQSVLTQMDSRTCSQL